MSTQKQRAASRANGQKSQGPVTTEGKAKSCFNALKHGIDARQQVMFTESAGDLAQLAAEHHDLHGPANADERFLVDTIAHNLFLEKHPGLEAAGPGEAFTGSGSAFERLQRIVNSCERHYRNARKQLQEAQAARAKPLPAPQPEQYETTSESPGSFHTNPQAAPKTPDAEPETPSTAVAAAAPPESFAPDRGANPREAA